MALYELTVFGRYFNQEIVNRFTYLSSGVGASVSGSFGLTHAFGMIPTAGVYPATSPFALWREIVHSSYLFVSAIVRQPADYDPEDFYERPFVPPLAGAGGGEAASPVLSYGFRTNRVRLDIDRGTKRLVGVAETAMAAGGEIDPGVLGILTTLAEAFSATLTYDDEGSVITYTPCVVKKEKYTTSGGKTAYRYYPTLAAQLLHVASGVTWQPYTTVRTQNSRQYGRGA